MIIFVDNSRTGSLKVYFRAQMEQFANYRGFCASQADAREIKTLKLLIRYPGYETSKPLFSFITGVVSLSPLSLATIDCMT